MEPGNSVRVGDRGFVNAQGGIFITVTELTVLGDDGILWAKCADARGEWRWIEAWRVVALPAADEDVMEP